MSSQKNPRKKGGKMDKKEAEKLLHRFVGNFPITEFYPAQQFLDWLYRNEYKIVKKQKKKK